MCNVLSCNRKYKEKFVGPFVLSLRFEISSFQNLYIYENSTENLSKICFKNEKCIQKQKEYIAMSVHVNFEYMGLYT